MILEESGPSIGSRGSGSKRLILARLLRYACNDGRKALVPSHFIDLSVMHSSNDPIGIHIDWQSGLIIRVSASTPAGMHPSIEVDVRTRPGASVQRRDLRPVEAHRLLADDRAGFLDTDRGEVETQEVGDTARLRQQRFELLQARHFTIIRLQFERHSGRTPMRLSFDRSVPYPDIF